MAMLSLLEIYCDSISDPLYLSINMRGRNTDHVHKRLRPNVPGYAGTRLPEERERLCRVVHSRDYRKHPFDWYPYWFRVNPLSSAKVRPRSPNRAALQRPRHP